MLFIKRSYVKNTLFIFTLLAISFTTSLSQVRLPKLISDGMVLQRDAKIRIWGWASPGEQVSVTFNNNKRKASANPKGEWSLEFPAMKAGGPYTMKFSG